MSKSYRIDIKLSNLNEYDTVKQRFQKLIAEIIKGMPEYTEPIGINFTWFEADQKHNFTNICLAKQLILAVMVKLGKIADDSSKYVKWFSDTFMVGEEGVQVEIITKPEYPISFKYNPNDISESSLEKNIEVILKEAGFNSNYNGFGFLKEGLKIIFMNKITLVNMEHHVYDAIAKKYNITRIAVSKAIWNMIQRAMNKNLIDPELLNSGINMTNRQVLFALLSRLTKVIRNKCYWEQIIKKRYTVALDIMVRAKHNLIEARNKQTVDGDKYSKARYVDCKSIYENAKTNYMNIFKQTPCLIAYEIDQKYIQDNYDLFVGILDIGSEITLLQMKGGRNYG